VSYIAASPGKGCTLFTWIIVQDRETVKLSAVAVLDEEVRVVDIHAVVAALVGAG
jgi:hypothetical protein